MREHRFLLFVAAQTRVLHRQRSGDDEDMRTPPSLAATSMRAMAGSTGNSKPVAGPAAEVHHIHCPSSNNWR